MLNLQYNISNARIRLEIEIKIRLDFDQLKFTNPKIVVFFFLFG